jgi:predicted nucleic acid-binding protein
LILIDTSVWIDFFNKKIIFPDSIFTEGCITPPIYQELLQGFRNDLHKKQAQLHLSNFILLGNPIQLDTYFHAAEIYRICRKNGVTIRPSIDPLIAAVAIENKVKLWSLDREFAKIAKYTQLQLQPHTGPF